MTPCLIDIRPGAVEEEDFQRRIRGLAEKKKRLNKPLEARFCHLPGCLCGKCFHGGPARRWNNAEAKDLHCE